MKRFNLNKQQNYNEVNWLKLSWKLLKLSDPSPQNDLQLVISIQQYKLDPHWLIRQMEIEAGHQMNWP